MLHVDPGYPLTLGRSVSVGHKVMLHGCTIGEGIAGRHQQRGHERREDRQRRADRRQHADRRKARRSRTACWCSARPARWCASSTQEQKDYLLKVARRLRRARASYYNSNLKKQ